MEKFKLKKGEENHIHLEIIKAEFDPKTGKQKFKPFVQTFTEKEYKSFLEHPGGMGIIKVHHLPKWVKTMEELKADYDNKVKGSRKVNVIDLSGSNIASMYEVSGDDPIGDDGSGEGDEDEKDPIEIKSMKNMKRDALDEYAKEFDIDPTDYSNATVLKEAIQMEIDARGLED